MCRLIQQENQLSHTNKLNSVRKTDLSKNNHQSINNMKKLFIFSLGMLFSLMSQVAKAQNIEDEDSRKLAAIRQAMPVEGNMSADYYLKEKKNILDRYEAVVKQMSKTKSTNPQYNKLSNDLTNVNKELEKISKLSTELCTSMTEEQLKEDLQLTERLIAITKNNSLSAEATKRNEKEKARQEKERIQEEKRKAKAEAEAQAKEDGTEDEGSKGLLSKMKAAGNKVAESTSNLYNKAKDMIGQDKQEAEAGDESEPVKADVDALLDDYEMQLDELKIAVNKKNMKQFSRIMKNINKDVDTLSKQEKTLEQQQRFAEQSQRLSEYSNKMLQQL